MKKRKTLPSLLVIVVLLLILFFGESITNSDLSKYNPKKKYDGFRPFIITLQVDSENSSCPVVTIRAKTHTVLTQLFEYDFDVDWNNDGVFDHFGFKETVSNCFDKPGTYQIGIRGKYPYWHTYIGDNEKLLSIDQWGDIEWESMENAFDYAENLVIKAEDKPNLSKTNNLFAMFRRAIYVNKDIGSWDISSIKNMDSMFYGVTMSTEIYDSILEGWSKQNLQKNVTFDAGNSNFCKAKKAREYLISNYNWKIKDGGLDCS